MIDLLLTFVLYPAPQMDFKSLAIREITAIDSGDYVHHECDQLACCDSFYDEETDSQ